MERVSLCRALSGAISALIFSAPALSYAQANFEAVQLGGRTSMMGGAAVVSGEDEATAFINPAAITRIPGQSLSFSTFAVQLTSRSISGALDPSETLGLNSSDSSDLNLRIVPNTFCLFLDGPPKNSTSYRSRHKYAMCAAATEREVFDLPQNEKEGNVGAAHATRIEFVRSTMAFAWGLQLNRDTSLGVTLRVDNAVLEDSTSASAYDVGGAGLNSISHAVDAWSWDTSVIIGMTSSISRVMTVGASLTTPSQHLLGFYEGHTAWAPSSGGQGLVQYHGDFRYNHPGGLKLGVSFTWPRLVFEVDGSFYGPQRRLASASFDETVVAADSAGNTAGPLQARGSVSERGKPVTNLAVGLEYFLQQDFSLVTGIQTDFSGLHSRQTAHPDSILFRQRKDMIHAAIGVSSYGSAGRLLLGLRGHLGFGDILIAEPSAPEPTFTALKQSEWGLSLLVSGRISFRSVRDTAIRAATPLTKLPKALEEDEKSENAEESPGDQEEVP